jgi:hypothetical protein
VTLAEAVESLLPEDVRQEEAGADRSAFTCPVARALSKKVGKRVAVNVMQLSTFVGDDYDEQVNTPLWVKNYINTWDRAHMEKHRNAK